jgi:integrase
MLRAAKPKGAPDDAMIFTGAKSGTYLRRSTVDDNFKLVIGDAKVPKLTVHATRHSHATALLRAGVNIKTISERLGHSNVQITWNTYAHVLPESHAEAADVVDSLFASKE